MKSNSKLLVYLVLVVIIIFHFVFNWIWINSGNEYFGFDVVHHLNNQLTIYYEMKTIFSSQEAFWEKVYNFFKLFSVKKGIPENWPHLTYVITSIFNDVLGFSLKITLLSNTFFLIILILSVYGIGARLGGVRIGLISALLVSLYPNFMALSRFYGLDFPLTAFVAGGIYSLLKTEILTKRNWCIIFGIISGLGILTKGQYLFFIAFPFLYVCYLAVSNLLKLKEQNEANGNITNHQKKNNVSLHEIILNILIVLFLILIITSFWWIKSIPVFLSDLKYHTLASYYKAGTYEPFASPPPFPVFTLGWMLFYFFQSIFSISPLFFIIFIISAVLLFKRKNSNFELKLIWIWIFGSYIIFTLISSKIGRYFFPVFPAFALISANGLFVKRSKWINVIFYSVITLGIIQYSLLSFGSKDDSFSYRYYKIMRKLPGCVPNITTDWARPPNKADWDDLEKISNIINDFKLARPLLGIVERENVFTGDAASWVQYYLRRQVPEIKIYLSKFNSYDYNYHKGNFDFLLIPGRLEKDWIVEYSKFETLNNHIDLATWFEDEAKDHFYCYYKLKGKFVLKMHIFNFYENQYYLLVNRSLVEDNISSQEKLNGFAVKGEKLPISGNEGFLLSLGTGKQEYLTISNGKYSSSEDRDIRAEIEYLDGDIHTTDDFNMLAMFESSLFDSINYEKIMNLDFNMKRINARPGIGFAIGASEGGYGIFVITNAAKFRVDFIYKYINSR